MTSLTPQHARTNAAVRAWRTFRRWRRTRPFWGGLFTIVAGLEIFATTQASLGSLTFQMGPTGFLSWLIPTILVTCGLLMWFTPAQRMFYAIVAAMTAVFSLIGVNLGGFLVGLLLGLVGGALGFAWAPVAPPEPGEPAEEPAAPTDEAAAHVTAPASRPTEPVAGEETRAPAEVPAQRGHQHGSDVDTTIEIPVRQPDPGRRSQLYVVTVVLLSLAAVGLVSVPGAAPAHAAPCPPPATPAPGGTPTPTPSTTATPAPGGDAAERDGGGNIIRDILEGIGDLIGIGGAPAAPASPAPTPSGTRAPGEPAAPVPTPSCPPGVPGDGEPSDPGEETATFTKRVDPPRDITGIGRVPSILTGSKLTNWRLKYVGVTNLPVRGGGTMEVLWFDIAKAVTDDFELKPVAPDGRRMSIKARPLTVEGGVRLFTPRFVGNLFGIKQVYTPRTPPPLPPGIEVPVLPIVFTDVEVQLAYIDCAVLNGKDLVNTP
ncbi:DUF6114 domain-containing protein [Phytohabitans kaempferiae]|uniref:DUF6114 domain-containing protein n=1 Tax=Phytohabitans kaempferiae TaxID=1620943 RepID=A0ABV6MFB4_9ACTN